MTYVINTEASIEAIADAIRAKTGSSEEMTVAEMPTEIASISGGGGVHTVNINGNNCSHAGFDPSDSSFGGFEVSNSQSSVFNEILEYFAAGYQVIIHLTYNNVTYDCFVWDIYDIDDEDDSRLDPFYNTARFALPYGFFTNIRTGILIFTSYKKYSLYEGETYGEYTVGIMEFGSNGSVIEYAGS